MTVILQVVQTFPDGTNHVVPMLYPPGRVVGKAEREQAENLDRFLRERVPAIAAEVGRLGLLENNALPKWHAVGRRLWFADDNELVSRADRENGAVWIAVRQYAPTELLPKGEEPLTPARLTEKLTTLEEQRRLGKKHDHFERCYKLGKYELDEVGWMTWSDFDTFLESPGLERDQRILPILADATRSIGRRLTRREFRDICKILREEIPTKQRERDTSHMPVSELGALVEGAFRKAVEAPG